MEQNQLDVLRQALIARREEIEQLNNTSKESADTVILDQSKVGRLSRMDALQAHKWHKRRRGGGRYSYRESTAHCIAWMQVTTVIASYAVMKSAAPGSILIPLAPGVSGA